MTGDGAHRPAITDPEAWSRVPTFVAWLPAAPEKVAGRNEAAQGMELLTGVGVFDAPTYAI